MQIESDYIGNAISQNPSLRQSKTDFKQMGVYFKSRPPTADLVCRFKKINDMLVVPYDPERMNDLIIKGESKLELESDVALKASKLYVLN